MGECQYTNKRRANLLEKDIARLYDSCQYDPFGKIAPDTQWQG